MSGHLTARAWSAVGVSPVQRLILLALADYVWSPDDPTAILSVSTLAGITSLSPETVRSNVAKLEVAGFVRRVPRVHPQLGCPAPNGYLLTLSGVAGDAARTPPPVGQGDPPSDRGTPPPVGQGDPSPRGTGGPPPASPYSPESVLLMGERVLEGGSGGEVPVEPRPDAASFSGGRSTGGPAWWATHHREAFSVWWEGYPRKDAKANAARIFERLARRGDLPPLDSMLRVLAVQRVDYEGRRRKPGGKPDRSLIPLAQTYLNQGRFADEVEAASPRGNRPTVGRVSTATSREAVR